MSRRCEDCDLMETYLEEAALKCGLAIAVLREAIAELYPNALSDGRLSCAECAYR